MDDTYMHTFLVVFTPATAVVLKDLPPVQELLEGTGWLW